MQTFSGIQAARTQPRVWMWHIVALVTALVWSTTFVSTKTLLLHGLTPMSIFIYRFAMAYLGLLAVCHSRWYAGNVRDEALLLLGGISGGSLYFLTENTALEYTYATNVSILISTTPLMTILLAAAIWHRRLKKSMLGGSLLALGGVVLVVLNGQGQIDISPVGDLLTLGASLCWAVYSIVMKVLGTRGLPTLFITRKIFFYGLVTMLVYYPFSGTPLDFSLLTATPVWGNLLFLGIVASLICYAVWNRVLEVLGADKATNYIYLSPLGAMTTAVLILGEPVSAMAICGALLTVAGVVIVEKT